MKRALDYGFYAVVIIAIVYHMMAVVYPLWSNIEHLNAHLALSLLLVFLAALRKSTRHWYILLPLIILTVAVTGYIKVFYWDIEAHFGIRTTTELVTAVLLVAIVIEGCRRAMGNVVPIVALVFMVYIFFGSYLPQGPFHIAKIEPVEIVNMLTYQFSGGAVYGQLLEVSAYFVIIFTIMGGVMQITAAPVLIRNLGLIVGRKLRGGPALMCIVGSSLVGMVTGAATPNIIVVGSFTIPLMKRVGYAPKEAAAIEAAASNGGQIMPPVMGAAAFVMSMVTGISYVTIMAAAFIPALLYFLSLGLYVQLLAMKRNIAMTSLGEAPDYKAMLLALPGFAVPLLVIVFLFIKGFSPMYVAFWGVIATTAMAILKPGKRPTGKQWLDGFSSGIMSGAIIAVSLATIGVVTKVLTVSGLGVKLPGIVEILSAGNLLFALFLVLGVCILLGMGVPTTPAYILVAMVGAPVLVELGVGLLPAHFFVFYYAVMALITPPVASAAIVSSQIAGASYVATGVEAIKIAAPSLLVPFIFIKNPIFLMQGGQGWLEGTVAILAGLILVLATSIAFVNHFFARLSGWERLCFALCAMLCFIYFIVWTNYIAALAGLVLFALLTLNQWRRRPASVTVPGRRIAMFQDFREYLGYLEEKGKLLRVKQAVSPIFEIAAGIRKTSDTDGPALLFENVRGYPGWRVAGGIFATQKLMALALGLPKSASSDHLLRRYLEFDETAVPPRLVKTGPVKEVILKGKEADLARIPVPTYSSRDAGPYITAGVDFAKNPDTGVANVSMHRQKVIDTRHTTFLARGLQHLARHIASAEKKGQALGVAVAIGLEPSIVIASQLQVPYGVDETGMAGALRGAPVEMVKCETIDAEVPAHAELVIEGKIVPGEKVTDGPFGEYPGNYSTFLGSPQVEAPLFEVTAITMRENPIFQAMLTGFPLPLTENHILRKWAVMASVHRISRSHAEVLEVYPTDSGGGQLWLVVKIKKIDDAQPRKIIDAIFNELRTPRMVTVVDDDIDIHNPAELEWATVTRARPDKSITIIPRDPPHPAKWGIDATMPIKEREWYERITVPGVDKVDYL